MRGRFSLRRIAGVFWHALTSTGMASSRAGGARRALEAIDPRLTIVFPRGMYERPAGFANAEARREYKEVLASTRKPRRPRRSRARRPRRPPRPPRRRRSERRDCRRR